MMKKMNAKNVDKYAKQAAAIAAKKVKLEKMDMDRAITIAYHEAGHAVMFIKHFSADAIKHIALVDANNNNCNSSNIRSCKTGTTSSTQYLIDIAEDRNKSTKDLINFKKALTAGGAAELAFETQGAKDVKVHNDTRLGGTGMDALMYFKLENRPKFNNRDQMYNYLNDKWLFDIHRTAEEFKKDEKMMSDINVLAEELLVKGFLSIDDIMTLLNREHI